MKLVLTKLVIALGIAFPVAAQITQIDHPDNLLVTNELGCIPLADAKAYYTPADLSLAVRHCIRMGDYDTAIQLFFLYSVYGSYDSMRISDRSAAAAIGALNQRTFRNMTRRQREGISQAARRLKDETGQFFLDTCAAIELIGPPRYVPIYMLAHGLSAFRFNDDGAEFLTRGELTKGVKNVAENNLWQDVLKTSNRCP